MNKLIFSIVPKKYIAPYLVTTALFFFWAFGVHANDILVAHFKSLFGLSLLQASLVPTTYFTGYFLASLPMGYILYHIGFSKTIRMGLLLFMLGALGFILAGLIQKYIIFLCALMVMAFGATALEVSANPYVTLLGPKEKATIRINFSHIFNALSAVVTVYGLAHLFLGKETVINVIKTYGVIACVFLITALLLNKKIIPDVKPPHVINADNSHHEKIFTFNSLMGFGGIFFCYRLTSYGCFISYYLCTPGAKNHPFGRIDLCSMANIIVFDRQIDIFWYSVFRSRTHIISTICLN